MIRYCKNRGEAEGIAVASYYIWKEMEFMGVRLGIVGTNFISDWLLEAAVQVPEVEVCSVYSRKQETGATFAGKHQIPRVYTEYESFLKSELDAVYIATPMYVHCRQTIEALKQGKHVLCEKILAVNEREVQQMIACGKKNQRVLLEAMRPDFVPVMERLKETLPKIGKLRRVTIEYDQYSSRYDSFRKGEVQNAFNPALSNAAIMDIGVYCVHSIVRLFGAPLEVKSCCVKLHNGFEANGIVLMQYEDFLAEAVYSKIGNSIHPSVFEGEEGTITLDSISVPKQLKICYRDGRTEQLCTDSPKECSLFGEDSTKKRRTAGAPHKAIVDSMVFEVRKFAQLVRENRVEHPYLTYSLDTIRVVDAVRKQNGIVFDADSVVY